MPIGQLTTGLAAANIVAVVAAGNILAILVAANILAVANRLVAILEAILAMAKLATAKLATARVWPFHEYHTIHSYGNVQ